MAKIIIRGKEYDLRITVYTMECLENEYGDMSEALKMIRGGGKRKIKDIKTIFAIMANAGLHEKELPEDVKPSAIDKCNLAELDEIAGAMARATEEAMHAETIGGNEADDDIHDEYMEELERKEKNA